MPSCCAHRLYGLSHATQILADGPLPPKAHGVPVHIATSLNGASPYFTASLESAVQAGAGAAANFDATLKRSVPRGIRQRLWPSKPLRWKLGGRHFELSTTMAGTTPERVWHALTTLQDWPKWCRLVPFGEGTVTPGQRLTFSIRVSERSDTSKPRMRLHRPHVLVVKQPKKIVLEASFGARGLLHMVHSFFVIPTDDGCVLRQTWQTSGMFVPLMWPRLRKTQEAFAEFGDELHQWILRD
jgi:hypothetical protein